MDKRKHRMIKHPEVYNDLGDGRTEIIFSGKKNNGKTIVSTEDVEALKQYYWHIKDVKNGQQYVEGKVNGKSIKMHRFIINAKKGEIVDHIDRNPLNNTRENLHIVSSSENNKNIKFQKNNHSGRMGVYYRTMKNRPPRFVAKATSDGIMYVKMFSIKKYGYDEAFKLACKQREKWENEFNIKSEKMHND